MTAARVTLVCSASASISAAIAGVSLIVHVTDRAEHRDWDGDQLDHGASSRWLATISA